jgi:hypothetical protein
MERTSKIRGLDLATTITLHDGILTETARFHVTDPLDLQTAYPFMYAWNAQSTHYVFGDAKQIHQRGIFTNQTKYRSEVIKNATWMAIFNATTGQGNVCCFTQHPTNTEAWFLLIDAPASYRKIAAYTLVDRIVPKGFEGTYQSAIGFFTATESTWEATAQQRAEEVLSQSNQHQIEPPSKQPGK